MNDVLAAFQDQGLDPGQPILDGKVHRFRLDAKDSKESGWYIGWQNHTRIGGEIFYVVVFGNHKLGEEYRFQSNIKMSAEDRRTVKEQIAKAQKIAEELKRRAQEEASEEVEKKWQGLAAAGDSEYLRRKQVVECPDSGIRFESSGIGGGSFYVPARDEHGKLWSLQKIQWDGTKFFHPGGRTSGCFHVLGSLPSTDRVLLAEGFATAASLRLATGLTVVCAFNSVNLAVVAQILRQAYPEQEFIVAGDDDKWTQKQDGTPWNPGREKAVEAGQRALASVVFPKFANLDGKPTDFNDLHVREGLDQVKAQVLASRAEKQYVLALGFKDKDYFFTSSHNRQIVPVNKFTETDFLGLAPLEYWEALYPGGGAVRVDWSQARSRLMDTARKRGIFQSRNVRGSGVWNDDGRTVVNMGDHLVADGERVELGHLHSRYFYTLGNSVDGLHPGPLSASECDTFIRACATFKWIKPDFGYLVAGALVTARVCGAIPVRPHLWLTGGAQNGKTTLLERLIQPILGEQMLYVQGATTEAGLRQSLHSDARPVIFDEFETSGVQSSERVAACIELMRASWSDSSAVIVKGSSGGTASHYQVRFSAIVSSIRTKLTNDADRSRFAIVELAPHGSDAEHWAELDSLLAGIDREYGNRLFARTVKLLPVLLQNFKTLKGALARKTSQRFGDQYGMLLAGFSILLQDAPLTDQEADSLVQAVELSEEKADAKVADQDDAWNHLCTKKIRFDRDGRSCEASVAELIAGAPKDQWMDAALQMIGLKVTYDAVSIASNHSELEGQVFRGTRWSGTWANTFSRLTMAEKNKSTWLGGKNQKCVRIPRVSLGLDRI